MRTTKSSSLLIALIFIALIGGYVFVEGAAAQEQVLVVGNSTILSGPAAVWGVPDYRAMELQIEEINKAGGIKIGGKTIKLKQVAMDNKYAPEDSVAVAMRMLEQEKVSVFHPSGGVPSLASLPVVKNYKVLTISGGYGKGIVSPANPYLFRGDPTTVEFATPVWQFVKERYPQLRRRVGITPNHDAGLASAQASEQAAKGVGIETVVPTQFLDITTTDFSSVLLKLLKANPDIIDCTSAPGAFYSLLIKQARELGYKGKIIAVSMSDSNLALQRAGKEAVEGVIFPCEFGEPLPPKVAAWKKKYEAKWGEWNPVSVIYTTTIELLVAAINAANSTDIDRLKAAMEDPKFRLNSEIYGSSYFIGKTEYGINHQLYHPTPISEIRDGKLVFLGMR
jgi:branched-chain amino acid transport system substrate-binding protein